MNRNHVQDHYSSWVELDHGPTACSFFPNESNPRTRPITLLGLNWMMDPLLIIFFPINRTHVQGLLLFLC